MATPPPSQSPAESDGQPALAGAAARQRAVERHLLREPHLYLVLLLLVASILLRHGLLFAVALVLLLAAVISRLWDRYCLAGLSYARRLSHSRAQLGEEVELVTELVNRKPLPLPWLHLEDEMPAEALPEVTGGAPLRRTHQASRYLLAATLSLGWYERVRRRYRVRCTRRGLHAFGPALLRTGDLFGFSVREALFDTRTELLVYPRVVPVERLGLPAGDPFGDRRTREWLFEDPLRVVGVREYTPRDSPRHIHWKATAHTGALQVKQYEPARGQRLVVCLDLHTARTPHVWQGYDPDLLELSVTVAASVAAWAAEAGRQVGLLMNGKPRGVSGLSRIASSRDPQQLPHILEALARLTPFATGSLPDLLRQERRWLPLGTTLVVVTGSADESLLAELLALRAAGHRVTLLLVGEDAATVDIPGLHAVHVGGRATWHDLDHVTPSSPSPLAASPSPQREATVSGN